MRTLYSHKQFGTFVVFACGAAILAMLVFMGPATAHPAMVLVLGVLAAVAVMFSSLTVEIRSSSLVFWFGPGLLRKTVPLADIASVEAVRNPWYWGIGLRVTPRGMLYSVSGLSAVEIARHDGGRFRLGTDEPERLERALKQALERHQ